VGNLSDKVPYLTYEIMIDLTEPRNRAVLGNYSKTPPINDVEQFHGGTTARISFQPSMHHPKIIKEITVFFQKLSTHLLGVN
jgi:hypothetical protein